MSDWKERLKTEHDELRVRYEKLQLFIEGDGYNELAKEDQDLLSFQWSAMQQYLKILRVRMSRAGI